MKSDNIIPNKPNKESYLLKQTKKYHFIKSLVMHRMIKSNF